MMEVTDHRPEPPMTAMLAVLPCNDLAASRDFYGRLGFSVGADHGDYLILTGHGTELHLTKAVDGWLVPGRNPFGLYLRVATVNQLAAQVPDLLLGGKGPQDQPWGMYEFAMSDPDETLVRVGWPTRLRAVS